MPTKKKTGTSLAGKRFAISATESLCDSETDTAPELLRSIRTNLRRLYRQADGLPWVIAYSGGKDSTLVLHLVFEMLFKLKPAERRREIHVISNDTLVESPLIIDHLKKNLELIKATANKFKLPLYAQLTRPAYDQTFWVNLIGKGYIPPTRNFRWCTDKMKIAPTDKHLRWLVSREGGAILLIGTRKQESQARKRRIELRKVDADGMNPHDNIQSCKVYTPIVELSNDQVWMVLLQAKNHWGTDHREMITIYRNARGGECPTVLTKNDAPSCGSTSPRFGCWTCTVVQKDRSLEGLVEAGYEIFEPLVEFRNWLQEIREDNNRRMSIRRNNVATRRSDGSYVKGPFDLATRREIYARLIELQEVVKRELIKDEEYAIILGLWAKDERQNLLTESFRERLLRKSQQLSSSFA